MYYYPDVFKQLAARDIISDSRESESVLLTMPVKIPATSRQYISLPSVLISTGSLSLCLTFVYEMGDYTGPAY